MTRDDFDDLPFVPEDAVTQFDDRDEMEDVTASLAEEGFTVHRIDCGADAAMLAGFDAALDWRAQFGQPLTRLDLDSLAEALRGVPSAEDSRVLLILDRFRELEARREVMAEGIADAIRDAAADHLEVNRRLLAFICTEDPDNDDIAEDDEAEDASDPAEEWLNG